MTNLILPDGNVSNYPPHYLAIEEYVARTYTDDDYFFTWRVEPSAIFGRNQLIENEVNQEYCDENNVKIFRRKSGGGCVYADLKNIMCSYITKDIDVHRAYATYMGILTDMLNKAGIHAELSGRNDVMVDGKKVAGTAFYRIPGRSILHNTLLFDTDLDVMTKVITPNEKKLSSKGVQSVRQHVCNINQFTDMSIEEFEKFAAEAICGGKERVLTEEDMRGAKEIEDYMLSPEFKFGKNPLYTIRKWQRFEGVGDFKAFIELKNDVIKNINIMGDFFVIGDLDREFLDKLHNVKFDRTSVAEALAGVDIPSVITGFKLEHLLDLLFKE